MNGGQFITKPENIDVVEMDSNKSLGLQSQSIDEETQAVDLTDKIDLASNEPKDMGGFSDIYQGTCVSIEDQVKTVVGAILHV
jgi:hypothetical protein